MSRAERLAEDAAPDLTSMIDVVFLLLIFFLCTLQFRALEGQLPTHLPRDLGGGAGAVTTLQLPLELLLVRDAGGPRVRLGPVVGSSRSDGGWIGVGGVEARVAAARARDPDLRVLIRSGEGVLHDDVVTVVDACLSAGIGKIIFGETR